MALSDSAITGIAASVGGDVYSVARFENIKQFARAIEAEVRKQDDALILQLVEALESARVWKCKEIHHMMREAQYTPAIQAARARLGEKT